MATSSSAFRERSLLGAQCMLFPFDVSKGEVRALGRYSGCVAIEHPTRSVLAGTGSRDWGHSEDDPGSTGIGALGASPSRRVSACRNSWDLARRTRGCMPGSLWGDRLAPIRWCIASDALCVSGCRERDLAAVGSPPPRCVCPSASTAPTRTDRDDRGASSYLASRDAHRSGVSAWTGSI